MPALRQRRGFTLIEMMVSMTLLVIVMGSVFGVMAQSQREYAAQREVVRAKETLQGVEILLTRVLKSGRADPQQLGVGLLDPDPQDHGTFDNIRVVSDLNGDGLTTGAMEDVEVRLDADTLWMRWQSGGAEQPVAIEVAELEFEYYAIDGTALTDEASAEGAARVRTTIAVRRPNAGGLLRRQSWTQIRN